MMRDNQISSCITGFNDHPASRPPTMPIGGADRRKSDIEYVHDVGSSVAQRAYEILEGGAAVAITIVNHRSKGGPEPFCKRAGAHRDRDRKSTRLNSSH